MAIALSPDNSGSESAVVSVNSSRGLVALLAALSGFGGAAALYGSGAPSSATEPSSALRTTISDVRAESQRDHEQIRKEADKDRAAFNAQITTIVQAQKDQSVSLVQISTALSKIQGALEARDADRAAVKRR